MANKKPSSSKKAKKTTPKKAEPAPAPAPPGVPGSLGAHYYLHDYLDLVIDANLAHGANGPRRGGLPNQNYTIAVSNLISAFAPASLAAIAPQLISSRPITAQET